MPTLVPVSERSPERGTPVWQLLLALSFGAFLTSLDAGAVNAVLPLIRQEFGATISSVQWVLAAELLVTSGLLLVFGRLGDRFGPGAVYRTGFGVFLCGCILCGLAPSLAWLIAFRSFQGIGTAMLLANSPAVLVKHAPAAKRGSGFGIKASCLYLGLMVGPVAGGWLAGRFGWRAVFGMELPAAIVGLAQATIFLPRDRPPTNRTRYDFAGACVWVLGLASLLWLFGRNRPGGVPAAGVVGAIVSVALLLALVAAEWRAPEPLFELSCFRRRSFAASVLSLGIAFAASYMLTFVLPFLLVEARHQSPSAVGRVLALYAMARSSVAWFSGRCSDRVDARLFAIPGMLLLACGLAALSGMDEGSPLSGALLLAGLGFGCFVPPNNSLLMGSVPPELYGFAAGIMATSRTVGMTVGVALGGAILSAGGGALVSRASLAFRMAALLALAGAIASAFATRALPTLKPARFNPFTR
jgi:EmrB/QacA subfamily drug resistance transporter